MSVTDPTSPARAEGLRGGLLRWPGAELDLRAAQVRRGGRPLTLDRSSYEVLLALLLRAGQVLSKDDLLEAAWPGRVVSENSLAKAISRLRRELGDDAAAPLQSVHGYGYRWAGDVQWIDAERTPLPDPVPDESWAGERWIGLAVPARSGWTFRRVLGRGGHSVVLLAESMSGEAPRAIKLGIGEEGLRHVRREVALHRYLTALDREVPGLAPALGWQLDDPPVFVEYPYFEEGDLAHWMGVRGAAVALPREHRLALVAQLAETLGELHAAGIVHQDLKPGNVFLRADPSRPEGWRTLLADLGGGHATPLPQGSEAAFDAILLGADTPSDRIRAGTAVYCAPEVLAGGLPTQRSDLFALGVILFQMAVGDLRRPLAPGWEADVDDPLLRDDIRTLASLRPEDRQLGAAQLAEHLRHLPERRQRAAEEADSDRRQREVEAQVQRQRVRLRLLGVASAALLAGLAVATWTGWLALDARAQEQRRREEAQAVLAFLTGDVLSRADPYRGGERDISLRASLDEAASRIDERLGDSPATAAAVHQAVAAAYDGWGDYAKAAGHLRRAIELSGLEPPAAIDFAALNRELCQTERLAGRIDAAQAACAAAASEDRRRLGDVTAATMVESSKLDYERGQCAEVSAVLQPILDARAARPLAWETEADALWFLGLCRSRLGEHGRGIEAFRALVALREQRQGLDHPMTAWALADYSATLARAGRFAEAEAVVDRMEGVFYAKLGRQHPDAVTVPFRRGLIAAGRGRDAEAAAWFAEAEEGWAATVGPAHRWTLLAGSERALALARAGDVDDAARVMARQQLAATPLLAERGPRSADLHERWAETLLRLGRVEEAREQLAAFDAIGEAMTAPGDPHRVLVRCMDSWASSLEGDAERAGLALAACRSGLAPLAPSDYRRRLLRDAEQALVQGRADESASR